MHRRIQVLFVLFGGLLSLAPAAYGFAQDMPRISVAAADQEMTVGEVRKIDKENGKVTIRHDEIKNLNMPRMTMVFQVREAALLEAVQPGDKIRFRAVEEEGKFVVTAMEPMP
jgi:Cu(I)/Ag(I) efflux system protein CusF